MSEVVKGCSSSLTWLTGKAPWYFLKALFKPTASDLLEDVLGLHMETWTGNMDISGNPPQEEHLKTGTILSKSSSFFFFGVGSLVSGTIWNSFSKGTLYNLKEKENVRRKWHPFYRITVLYKYIKRHTI